ncbi:MAG: hypothetical protein HY073_04890 [Deltaproteobacteria bacterium]|nr:hypothetical protein [Deltaproteobacteria bacterium]
MNTNTRKKTLLLPQNLINKMKRNFKVKTDTQAVIRAMEEMAFQKEVLGWFIRNQGRLKIKNVYGR